MPTRARPARRATPKFGEDVLLLDVLEAARRFLSLQARAAAQAGGQLSPPRNLAEAIDRDFLLFDLHDATRDLRDAVQTADGACGAMAAAAGIGMAQPRNADN